MKKQLAAGLAALALLAAFPLLAQESLLIPGEPEEKLDELEPVIVVGGFATPRMWKVWKGDHVMWVLGNGGTAPAGVRWRSEPLATRVAESQLVLYPGLATVDVDVGFFRMISMIPAAFRATKNPDNKKLKDVLPPETYARWRVLKTEYAGKDDDIERWRPLIAIEMLAEKVEEKLRPADPRPAAAPATRSMGPALRPLVDEAAKKHKVKVRTMPKVQREYKVKKAKEMLKSLRDTNVMDQLCFTNGLDYLERRIEFSKQNADRETRDTAVPPRREGCDIIKALRSGEIPDPAGIVKTADEMALQWKLAREQLDAEWIAAAQGALAKNKSTFAVLSMRQIAGPDSLIEKLRNLGYQVEEPGASN